MIERLSQEKLFWVNLKNPTSEEVHEIMHEFALPPGLMNDLLLPSPKNYAVLSNGMIKLAVDFPVVKRIDKNHPYEVKFIIAKQGLITVQYEEMEALDRFKKQFEVIMTLNKASKHLTGAHLFISLMGELYSACSTKLDYIESILSEIEADIFKDNEREMVIEIAKTSKKLIAFRHTLLDHKEVYEDAFPIFVAQYKETFVHELENINKTYELLLTRTNNFFEILHTLQDTNFAMLTARQNEIMKTLTIMAFITFPLSLLTSTFGMNTVSTPILGSPGDFWIILSIMGTATLCFFIFFKYKKWM